MISIIIPTYNRAYIIQQAIDSVLAQTYQDWELIIVDDGSTDDTEAVVKKNTDKRIRYIKYSPNQGANHARNVGMEAAKGECFAFLDSDAAYESYSLMERMEAQNKYDADIVWSRAKFVDTNGDYIIFPEEEEEFLNDREKMIPLSLKEGLINTSTLLIKRECYLECGGFDETLPRFQDWDYFLKLITEDRYRIHFLSAITVTNYLQKNSISLVGGTLREGYALIVKNNINLFRKYKCLNCAWEKFFLWGIGDNYYQYLTSIIDCLTVEELMHLVHFSLKNVANFEAKVSNLYSAMHTITKKIEKMQWRFPYGKVPAGARIVMYGAGDIGKSFVRQIEEVHYCDIVLWVDKNYEQLGAGVHSPQKLIESSFDYVVIAIFKEIVTDEILQYLLSVGVPREKIITI